MANEKRLIDAEAIARKLKKANCSECNVVRKIQCSACWVNDVLELLEGDAVDAVEVVHGRWEKDEPDKCGNRKPRCSVCGEYHLAWWADYTHCNYCPNCGAKMDGDGNV